MHVDAERLRERAIQLRNQSEFLLDQASAAPTKERRLLELEAREDVFVAYALMLVAEVIAAQEEAA